MNIKNGDMRDLVDYAKGLGWGIEQTNGKHLKFFMPGTKPVFTSSTPSDRRSWRNCKARLKRFAAEAAAMAA
jgi:hypothetical protein